MKTRKTTLTSFVAAFLLILILSISSAPLTTSQLSNESPSGLESEENYTPLQSDITFTSGDTIDFYSTEEMTIALDNDMTVWSGVFMNFSFSQERMQIIEIFNGNGVLEPCDEFIVLQPAGYLPDICSWWEVVDASGKPVGEFHVDWTLDPNVFHIDMVYPGPIQLPLNPGDPFWAIKKIDIVEPCQYYEVHWPSEWWPEPCTWWEIMDPETGEWTGFEFHVDWTNESCEFHIDEVIPGPYIPPFPWYEIQARLKIPWVEPCDYLVVEEPSEWWPEPCTWWEIIDPSGLETGFEFHVDWTNESCEFHIDDVIPEPWVPSFPVPYFIARQKITTIEPCDWFVVVDPPIYDPEPCTWWEILDPTGEPTDLEFHVDDSVGGMFHVDEVNPPTGPIQIPWLSPTLTVRKKIDDIQPCSWFKVADPPTYLEPCSWWKITYPDVGDVEFHVDDVAGDGWFHIDEVIGTLSMQQPVPEITAERKIDDIQPCDWFIVVSPQGFLPQPCSWWEIVWPPVWEGIVFHVDSNNGVDAFHIDDVDGGGPPPPPPPPPPWNVTARIFEEPELPWYMKSSYPDYTPYGMPDFDQRQWGVYPWTWGMAYPGTWTHCGPVAVANSLWWLDSEFESNTIPPPAVIDNYPLVQSYGQWDDHDPLNVPPLVEHLAYLMDTDGLRTGYGGHFGTDVFDMQAGITHYLSWSGVNPLGDVDGDGNVTINDANIVEAALGTVPGMPGWDIRADVWPVTTVHPPVTDNVIDLNDLALVSQWMSATGQFYEHTEMAPSWGIIVDELLDCQDVVLLIAPWFWDDNVGGWYRYDEGAHYVTVAGLNDTAMELVLSDPIRDNAEAGGYGNVPLPHTHLTPEPPYITHNDASLVSHDAYHVIWDPCPGGPLTIIDYPGAPGPYPEWRVQIEAAVITSPHVVESDRDVAVINMTTSKTGCLPMETVGNGTTANVTVTVENQGIALETFNVTVKANATPIGVQTVALNPGENKNLTFVWDTTTFAHGDYTISAEAEILPGETDIADNSMIYGIMRVTWAGDVDGDSDVDIFDIVRMATIYGVEKPDPAYDPNCDLDNDGDIDIFDIVRAAGNYGK